MAQSCLPVSKRLPQKHMITIHLQSNPEITPKRLLSVLQKLSKLARWQRNKVDNNIFASQGIGQTFLSEGPCMLGS